MSRLTLLAAGSIALAAIFLAVANFRDDEGEGGTGPYIVTVGIAIAATAVLFWLARRYLDRPATPALVFAIVGAVSLVVFWSGLPPPFAAAAAFLGLETRDHARAGGDGAGKGTAALALAALTAVAFVVLCTVG
jgi:hypothetical protein